MEENEIKGLKEFDMGISMWHLKCSLAVGHAVYHAEATDGKMYDIKLTDDAEVICFDNEGNAYDVAIVKENVK